MDRYLEALEQARNYYPDNLFLDTIFPELAESEDERIRKWLVELVKNTDTNHSNIKLSENCKLALAYLEKQKEQKPTEWSEEDEYCRNQLIVFCENCMQQDSAAIRCANWLKSLRPSWKPSEEQIWALERAITTCERIGGDQSRLKALCEQLKLM